MAVERETETIEASPAEARFLRRFVRRTTFPWIACVGALAGLALGVALAPPPPVELDAPAPSDVQASAAHEKLRAEIANLREELEVLRSAEPAESPRSGDFEARLGKLEAERAEPATQVADAAPAPESSGELATIRDRLYELERSLQTEAAARVDNLETSEHRLERLELRLSTLESLPAAPASPAP